MVTFDKCQSPSKMVFSNNGLRIIIVFWKMNVLKNLDYVLILQRLTLSSGIILSNVPELITERD